MADKQKTPLGPTGETLMRNIRRIREGQRLTYVELSGQLASVGRPIPVLGLRRIEKGERRVDADDLVALAVVLNVSPLALLLPPNDGHDPYISLTSRVTTTLTKAWKWATGVSALPDQPGEDPSQEKQEAYEQLSHSSKQRYVKRKPAGRAVDVLHDEVYRLVQISGVSTEGLDEEFERRLDTVRAWLGRLGAEVDRSAAEHAELSRWAKQPKDERRQAGQGDA